MFPASLCGVLVFDSVSRLLPAASSFLHSHTRLCHTPSFTHNFVTHHLSHTTLLHIIFHTQLCHTSSFTHPSFTHNLCHTQLHHTSSVTHPSFTHTFVTHTTSSHIIFSHNIFHTQLGWVWWRAWTGLVAGDAAALCVAGVALGDIHLRFAWQAWRLATSTFVLPGKRGAWRHAPSFCVAGVALVTLGWVWWRAWTRLVAGDAAELCAAGVALGDIHVRFAWLVCHLPSFTQYICHTPSFAHNCVTHHLSHGIFLTLWTFWPQQK